MNIQRTELNDTSPMPFGKYRGTPMQDVPVGYLHWLWCNGVKGDKNGDLHKYIVSVLNALKDEDPDRIW